MVLYEMVSGRRPFEGTTQSDVLASLLDREPTATGSLLTLSPSRFRAHHQEKLWRKIPTNVTKLREDCLST